MSQSRFAMLAGVVVVLALALVPTSLLAQQVGLFAPSDDVTDPSTRTLIGLLAEPPTAMDMDAQLVAMAERVEGFGGYFYDRTGQITVYVKGSERFDHAGLAKRGVRVIEGDYDFAELKGFHDRLGPVAGAAAGVVFTDTDEAANRVRIGVEPGTPKGAILKAMADLGIPREAVEITETEPIQLAATLRDRFRPVPGGVQIAFGSYVCTAGFNVSTSTGNKLVTNSHCTNVQGGTEGTQYYQNTVSGSNFIGTEEKDPTYFTGGACPSTRRCRYSDSALIDYASNSTAYMGRIARTTGSGSLTQSGYFSITASVGTPPPVGLTLDKVGRTTGWTWGPVTNSCVNINVSGTNITQLCSSLVSAGVNGGDSGSPVFYWSGSGSNVTLYGILWGGGGGSFAFSSLNYVISELGL